MYIKEIYVFCALMDVLRLYIYILYKDFLIKKLENSYITN